MGNPVSPGTTIGVELVEPPWLPAELEVAWLLFDEDDGDDDDFELDLLELTTDDCELDIAEDVLEELDIPLDDSMDELFAPTDCMLLETPATALEIAGDEVEGVPFLPEPAPQAASVRLRNETQNRRGKAAGLISFSVIRLFPV